MTKLDSVAATIRTALPGLRAGLVLGSGLGEIAERIDCARTIPYAELPGFPQPGVDGHSGRLVLGRLGGLPIACLQGRVHWYEGAPLAAMRLPIRALRHAGAEILVLTNAAGSLREEVGAGRLMMISDHINLIPGNPLAGPNDDEIGPRFTSMRDAYDPALRRALRDAAGRTGIPLAAGVYAPASRWRRASTSPIPGRASRPRPRSVRSARSAPTPSACRPCRRRSSRAIAGSGSAPSR
jgi:xanthosine phosphorylase